MNEFRHVVGKKMPIFTFTLKELEKVYISARDKLEGLKVSEVSLL